MHEGGFFFQAFIYLTAAVLSVPIAKKLGLGSVLGYLLAGVLIGPFVFGLVGKNALGKSLFVKMLAGVETPDKGSAINMKVSYKPQYIFSPPIHYNNSQ